MCDERERIPVAFASLREWAWPRVVELMDYPDLQQAWARSQEFLCQIQQRLASANLSPHVRTVAVSGSFGRMEAVSQSDCDLIVVLEDGVSSREPAATQAWGSVWRELQPLGLMRPRAGGIFATPTTSAELCNSDARGRVDEHIPTFGKRFQLLWDAQPVYGEDVYDGLLSAVIGWYTAVSPGEEPIPWWRYLLNDLIRYYRSLCVNYQWETSGKPGRRRLRNLKLVHSRLVMYAALLCLLGEGSRANEEPTLWLKTRLRMTPLERLAWCYQLSSETGFARIAGGFNEFLALMGDADFRAALEMPLFSNPTHPAAYMEYSNCHNQAVKLERELARFIKERQTAWEPSFAVSLLF